MQLSKTNYCRIFAFLAVMLIFDSFSAHADYYLIDSYELGNLNENYKFQSLSEGVYQLKLDYLIEQEKFLITDGENRYGSLNGANFQYEMDTRLDGENFITVPSPITDVTITLNVVSSQMTINVTGKDAMMLVGNWDGNEAYTHNIDIYHQVSIGTDNYRKDTYNAKILRQDSNGDWVGSVNLNSTLNSLFFRDKDGNHIPYINNPTSMSESIEWEDESESISKRSIAVHSQLIKEWRMFGTGLYHVKLHLDNDPTSYEETGTFTISKVPFKTEKEEVSFVWSVEDKIYTEGGAHDNPAHSSKFGNNCMLTLGVKNMEPQDALNEVLFQVRYREPGYLKSTSPAEVNKRRATDNSNRDEEGYNPATENEYTLLPTNSTINFKAAGDYKITTSIPSSEKYVATPSTFYLTVSQATLYLGSEPTQPFNADINLNEGANIFEGLIEFTSNLEYNKDFTVSVQPADANWRSYSSTEGTSLAAQYEAAFEGSSGDLYTQLAQIGFETRVDGFYYETGLKVGSITEGSLTTNGNYAFDLPVTVPCSGGYIVKVSPTSTNAFEEGTTKIYVYPNLYATFKNKTGKNETGFNINGYMWDKNKDNEYVITLPVDTDLEKCVGFIPGTYFASSLTTNATTEEFSDGTKDMVYRTGTMNLTRTDNGITQLTVNVSKNGANSPDNSFIFDVTTGDENNPSTGVDVIGIDSQEPVYFNLQGLRVENPGRGIFIKVSNGKASKVVF